MTALKKRCSILDVTSAGILIHNTSAWQLTSSAKAVATFSRRIILQLVIHMFKLRLSDFQSKAPRYSH